MFIGTCTGIVERDDLATHLDGTVVGLHLPRHPVRFATVDREHVPVHRSVGRRAHRREQLDLIVGEPVETAGHDALERRSFVEAGLLAQREQLVGRRPAAGHRLALTVGVRRRVREREADRPRRERSRQLTSHRGDLVGVGRVADRLAAHDVPADRAVADEEPGIDRHVAVEPVEVLGKRLPAPVGAVLERGERHALDLGHHLAQVVVVARPQRGEREAAVAPDDRGDAVDTRGTRCRIPQQLGVVVGVRVDETRRDDQPRGVDHPTRGLVDVAHRDDTVAADPDIGDATGRARAVDDGSALDQLVQHGPHDSENLTGRQIRNREFSR